MDNPIEAGEKAAADKKAAIRFLKSEIKELAEVMGHNFAKGLIHLAAHDAHQLSVLMTALSQIDVS